MKSFIVGTIVLLQFACAWPTAGRASDDLSQLPSAVKAARASVAWITYENTKRASGFVIDRGDGKKVIVTAGHVYQGPMVLSARLDGMPRPIPCELVDVNQDLDLMVVSPVEPISAPALHLAARGKTKPELGDRVWLVGCPGGLELSFQDGFVNSNPTTAEALYQLRTGSTTSDDPGPQGSTLLIRHNAFSTEGMSGSPLLDNQGNVVGIQSGILPDAKKECFAVASNSLASLDLTKSPRAFGMGPRPRKKSSGLPSHSFSAVSLHSSAPVLTDVNGSQVDGQCLQMGAVKSEADSVINGFMQDPDLFRAAIPTKQFQTLLNETPLVAYTNPVFGFRFLAPNTYSCVTTALSDPDGILVTLTNRDPSVPAAHRTITIRALVATDYLAAGRIALNKILATDGYRSLGDMKDNNFVQAGYRRGITHGVVLGKAEARFLTKTLDIRVKFPNGDVLGSVDSSIFDATVAYATGPVSSSWVHTNYLSETEPIVHSVHTGIWENVVVIVHYQLTKRDLDDLKSHRELNRSFRDRYIIRSSVFLY